MQPIRVSQTDQRDPVGKLLGGLGPDEVEEVLPGDVDVRGRGVHHEVVADLAGEGGGGGGGGGGVEAGGGEGADAQPPLGGQEAGQAGPDKVSSHLPEDCVTHTHTKKN